MIAAILRELTGPEARDVLVVVANDVRRREVWAALQAAGVDRRGTRIGRLGLSTVRVAAESGGFPELAGLTVHSAYVLDPIGGDMHTEVRYRLFGRNGTLYGWGGENVAAVADRGEG